MGNQPAGTKPPKLIHREAGAGGQVVAYWRVFDPTAPGVYHAPEAGGRPWSGPFGSLDEARRDADRLTDTPDPGTIHDMPPGVSRG